MTAAGCGVCVNTPCSVAEAKNVQLCFETEGVGVLRQIACMPFAFCDVLCGSTGNIWLILW